ncbi:heavy-metal-associated domain-containing protein [Pedobacter rhodius]|uniref:Cation transporter n=1 Tax=Pedobacter rhodius TaxID=3004098 RepID=A0ABT4KZA0_9SPHI|nr:cation transporter [Pedobacter sp. SJ11]MCZ4224125.1 cation transporter [Pedobacter sp. SJ11]
MTHTYQLTGMTCGGCENKVKSSLLVLPEVTSVEVSKDTNSATITMDKHVGLNTLQEALGGAESKYQIAATSHIEAFEETKSWAVTYKPILLIFGYVTVISLVVSWQEGAVNFMTFMRIFMGGFFLTFSFFKMLNLKAFAESYAMYDIVAKKFNTWGYIYAFIELGLGLSFAINLSPVIVNWVTLIVMTVSILGVLESVLNKKKIQCACLGAVFNLPMSTVTIVEDAIMIAMSAAMLVLIYL